MSEIEPQPSSSSKYHSKPNQKSHLLKKKNQNPTEKSHLNLDNFRQDHGYEKQRKKKKKETPTLIPDLSLQISEMMELSKTMATKVDTSPIVATTYIEK